MDLKHLKIFLAVYEEKSFTRAAAKLNSTQPGISVQIAALEAELGVRLFERHSRSIEPTVAAKRFYRRGVQILRDTNDAREEMRALSGAVSGKIAAGIPPTLSASVLASTLSRFIEQYPNVQVRVVESYSRNLLNYAENQEIDFAFVTLVPDHPAIKFDALFEDRFVVVSGPHLELGSGTVIRLDKPPFHQLVIPSLRHGLYRLLEEPLRTGRILPARLVEIDGLVGTLEFVANAEWAALLPLMAVQRYAVEKKLHIREIAGKPIPVGFFTAYRRTEPLSLASRAFVSIVQSELLRLQREQHLARPAARKR